MKTAIYLLTGYFFIILIQCTTPVKKVDLIVHHAKIYTLDKNFSQAEAMAIKDGKIIAIGDEISILKNYSSNQVYDAKEQFVYPGFIDAHCHFAGYAQNLKNADLTGTKSFDEVIDRLVEHNKKFPAEWILGRGWDQNDWEIKKFPTREKLDKLFPDTPVFIRRIDGHGAIANREALRRAGVTTSTRIKGGDLIKENGKLTGVLIDNAMGLVSKVIPPSGRKEEIQALLKAQENCFAVGLTSVFDAGLGKNTIQLIDSMQHANALKIRMYIMLSPSKENFETYMDKGVYQTDRLTIRSVKLFADGALGSRGAKLLKPYSDDPGNSGLLVSDPEWLKEICEKAYVSGYQVNTHCIGDSANRLMLNTYGKILKGPNDLRWRIEHAQIIAPEDFQLFGKYNIIPSIQTTHATSDMYWAEDRLGPERIKGAYAYHQLLEENGWIPNGSDFPVEDINPLYGFYAAVSRQDKSGYPPGGFQIENALTREEALKAMTIWAAKSGFEENRFGSLEVGKFADFVVLPEDLMECDIKKVVDLNILQTYIQGEKVFPKE